MSSPNQPSADNPINRREFLGSSAANAAGMAAGMVSLAGAIGLAQDSPAERVRVAIVGVRNQGKTLVGQLAAMADVDIAAICDVDENQFAPVMKLLDDAQRRPPRIERDFRRLLEDPSLDALVIATPDHHHAAMTTLACEAGKDVYIETPASHTLAEGAAMLNAALRHGRVVQTGLVQRSGLHFRSAVEFVRSGKLGLVPLAKAWTVHQRKSIGRKTDSPAPPAVDYAAWLGAAPPREFDSNRFHHNWQWFWDYGSGELGHWGVHLLDVARWGLGVAWPETVTASGGKLHFDDDQETPDTMFAQFQFASRKGEAPAEPSRLAVSGSGGTARREPRPPETRSGNPNVITWEHRQWSLHGQEGRSAAVAFCGERGTLIVDRGGWKVYGLKDDQIQLASGSSPLLDPHLRNFIDCVKSRSTPAADLETGLTSSGLCHLGNLAYQQGRRITVEQELTAMSIEA
jgi:predicted dehydrogenase